MKRKSTALPVRVRPETYELLHTLAAKAARDGWKSLGIKREDSPTMAALIDAAVTRLWVQSAR